MPHLSAHLGYLFTELPLEARFQAARDAGFNAVEHPAPFAIPAARLRTLLDDLGLALAQITSGMGNPGEKGIASLPGREAEFRTGYARALDYAEAVGCPFVHAMAGVGGDPATYRGNIDAAIRLCEGRRPRLLVEAISDDAVPGYHLSHIDDLLALGRTHAGQIGLLIDTFHARADGHDPATALRAAGANLAHVHIADFPGRHQPGTGTIDFAAVRDALADIGFRGAIGFEYLPDGTDHFTWLTEWRESARAGRHPLHGEPQ
ncbi:MAG: TIM barrel protein [Paracoccus sp. (in: a-proteobacteria)]|uniref:TIM barrel protein n=1 Tax=Paracoccus sp. TaxID=267 RepID=UPI0026DF7B19|nr:TIM barrel protein [Paracoccus sp. (in: a-proteobacteria)]MDO5633060.1 TIM barrel protein [Paracoccus sp. (in: a-proteobacteria)]